MTHHATLTSWLRFARTQALLERYLPAAPAIIADVGGGPGRYAVWLAERGYRVHLVDPVPLPTLAVEGAAWLLADLDARLADARRRAVLLAALATLETEATLLGVSAHLLAVARRG